MRDAKIVTLYKNKGDKGDCNNYRGISLLSVAGKAFARVILSRLQKLAERVLPETQCGFRSGRSTTDMIFTLRQIQEKCREQRRPLIVAFVDLTKAFDTVSRPALYKVLGHIGCPPKLLRLVVAFHEDMNANIQFDGNSSDSFKVKSGVKQGCVLAPTLFGIFFAVLLDYAFDNAAGDIFIRTRFDGSLFNLARLRAKTKVTEILIKELLFADDAALLAHDEGTLQSLINNLARACDTFSLSINISKTVILPQACTSLTGTYLNGSILTTVNKFCYLGSTITSTFSLEEEINARIGNAATNFGRLSKRAWDNKRLTLKTKIQIYRACVLSTLLYSSETWTPYSGHVRRLNVFHLRCLRKLMGIRWQDKITNTEVLKRADLPSIMGTLSIRRLRWLGHVRRMDSSRIPKQVLFGELSEGRRHRGRPMLRYKDVCKTSMKDFCISTEKWEKLAEDRTQWKTSIHKGARTYEDNLRCKLEIKRTTRKDKVQASTNLP